MTHTTMRTALTLGLLTAGCLISADPLSTEITNGLIQAKIYLPNGNDGFYHTTRFDWSGIVASLKYKGHTFYGPWFYKVDHSVYDLGYDEHGVISADFTAMVGPGEEFNSDGGGLGFAEAQPGGTFIKIGVGVLRKPMVGEPSDPPRPAPTAGRGAPPGGPDRYDHSRTYQIVDPGKWTVKKNKDSVEFTQVLNDTKDGYGYIYHKVLRLVPGKAGMIIEHRLENTGSKVIKTNVYNHNFFVLDQEGPSEGLTVTVPYQIQPSQRPPTAGLLDVRGNQVVYLKTLVDQERASASLPGFGDTAKDYDIRVENKRIGAGYHVVGDRPLSNIAIWSIRTVMAVEPYVAMSIDPGKDFTWKLTYDYFTTK
ncbi:MAG: hypothetical protein ABI759_25650 [Candidatus Solibacter sp.]